MLSPSLGLHQFIFKKMNFLAFYQPFTALVLSCLGDNDMCCSLQHVVEV